MHACPAPPGLLYGGTFNGTFSASLPISNNGYETISTFNINLINSSGAVLYTLSNANGGVASVTGSLSPHLSALEAPLPLLFQINPCDSLPNAVACDEFDFTGQGGTVILQLTTPAGFTGGSLYPFLSVAYLGLSPLNFVTSDTIDPATPTPEPSAFILLGTALLAGLWVERRRPLA